MGTKNNPGSFDCYAAALPDEPLFHLLGRDPAFPATVRFWMGERARLGKNVESDDLGKLGEAGQVADKAQAWRDQIVESLEPEDYPWRNRGHVDSYDRDPPVRWSGDQGGAVRVQEIPGWDEWATAGSIALARRHANSPSLTLAQHAELIAATERSGWHYEQTLLPSRGGGYEVLFRRLDYVFSAQVEPLRIDETRPLTEAIQDNLHLRAKMVVGLNQVANDLHKFVNGKVSDPENHESAKALLAFVDRINGHAAELGDGVPVDMIRLPADDPTRGADTSHATVAVAPEDALDFGDPEPVLDLTPDMAIPAPGVYREDQGRERPCNPLDEDCTGMGRGLQP